MPSGGQIAAHEYAETKTVQKSRFLEVQHHAFCSRKQWAHRVPQRVRTCECHLADAADKHFSRSLHGLQYEFRFCGRLGHCRAPELLDLKPNDMPGWVKVKPEFGPRGCNASRHCSGTPIRLTSGLHRTRALAIRKFPSSRDSTFRLDAKGTITPDDTPIRLTAPTAPKGIA